MIQFGLHGTQQETSDSQKFLILDSHCSLLYAYQEDIPVN